MPTDKTKSKTRTDKSKKPSVKKTESKTRADKSIDKSKKTSVKKTSVKKELKTRTESSTRAKLKIRDKYIYFDNNSTTLICDESARELSKWQKCYNPSSDSGIAEKERQILKSAAENISNIISAPDHSIIFTSGATESNCYALRSCAEAFKRIRGVMPEIIISAVEHHSVIECAESLQKNGIAKIICIKPESTGHISADMVAKFINGNTCLVSVMHANNEIGSVNDIYDISKKCHEKKVPFMSDCSQTLGKLPIICNKSGSELDIITGTAHKFYGPKGIGIIAISNRLISGYKLEAQITGTQQRGLRGGTENIPAIAAMSIALTITGTNRLIKNAKLEKLCDTTISEFKKHFPVLYMSTDDLKKQKYEITDKTGFEIRILGSPIKSEKLPNTLLLVFLKSGNPFCNVIFKKMLDEKKVAISISSACLTSSPKASHVLTALGANKQVKEGVIRISFGDHNTIAEVKKFVEICTNILKTNPPTKSE